MNIIIAVIALIEIDLYDPPQSLLPSQAIVASKRSSIIVTKNSSVSQIIITKKINSNCILITINLSEMMDHYLGVLCPWDLFDCLGAKWESSQVMVLMSADYGWKCTWPLPSPPPRLVLPFWDPLEKSDPYWWKISRNRRNGYSKISTWMQVLFLE